MHFTSVVSGMLLLSWRSRSAIACTSPQFSCVWYAAALMALLERRCMHSTSVVSSMALQERHCMQFTSVVSGMLLLSWRSWSAIACLCVQHAALMAL